MKYSNSFNYLNHKFQPLGKLPKNFDFCVVTRECRSIGISKYQNGTYSHRNFYQAAKKIGAGETDVFLMDKKTIVLPCQNELFEYRGKWLKLWVVFSKRSNIPSWKVSGKSRIRHRKYQHFWDRSLFAAITEWSVARSKFIRKGTGGSLNRVLFERAGKLSEKASCVRLVIKDIWMRDNFMSDQANSKQPKNQIVYFFSGVPTIFVCPACEMTADYDAAVRNKSRCLECNGRVLTFTSDPLEYTESLNENDDQWGGLPSKIVIWCLVEKIKKFRCYCLSTV